MYKALVRCARAAYARVPYAAPKQTHAESLDATNKIPSDGKMGAAIWKVISPGKKAAASGTAGSSGSARIADAMRVAVAAAAARAVVRSGARSGAGGLQQVSGLRTHTPCVQCVGAGYEFVGGTWVWVAGSVSGPCLGRRERQTDAVCAGREGGGPLL